MPVQRPLLEMKGITKRFQATTALSDVSFNLLPGEVHCLVGENGAGKSTLMKILSGGHQRDEGQILLEGVPIEIRSPMDGLRQGIGVVYQELELVPDLTVAENIMMGIRTSSVGFMKWRSIHKQAKATLEETGLDVNTHTYVRDLTVAQSQLVAIAKVLALEPRILVLDEPSAVLAGRELDLLFELINKLRQKGTGIIYISHRLEEIFQIGNRITVLRDGHVIDTLPVSEVTENKLIELMVGRQVEDRFPERVNSVKEDILLSVNNLSSETIRNITFDVHKGEILGIAGLVGSGQNVLAKTLYGLTEISSGDILINGAHVKRLSPQRALKVGIALVPEERKTEGLVLMHSIFDNLTYSVLHGSAKSGILSTEKLKHTAQHYKQSLSIKMSSLLQAVGDLSGGNQQKVVMAKALSVKPQILVLDEPTRGVDVGAKSEFYQLIIDLAKEGHAIILISSELVELTALSHRIAVMSEGRISNIFEPPYDEREILRYALPQKEGA